MKTLKLSSLLKQHTKTFFTDLQHATETKKVKADGIITFK